jgi:hypothetical protein
MSANHIATLAFASLAAISGLACAGDFQYECTVRLGLSLTEQGTLSPHQTSKSIVGATFTVDRVTGRIIGGPLDNPNLRTEVLDRGSREMSFQAFSRSTQMSHSTHIEIQEFVSGAEKPFVATTTLYFPGVYSGICK